MEKNVYDAYSIKNQAKIITVPAGITILSEGEVNLDMYKLITGHVEMYRNYGTENEVLIGLLGPGACFGEFGLLLGKPAIYTIISYSEIKLLRVTQESLDDFVKENQQCIVHIMKNMASMMMAMTQNLTQLSNELEEMHKKYEGVDLDEKGDHIVVTDEKFKELLRKYALKGSGFHYINKMDENGKK